MFIEPHQSIYRESAVLFPPYGIFGTHARIQHYEQGLGVRLT